MSEGIDYLSALPLAALVLDNEGSVIELNPAAQDLFQRSARSLVGERLGDLFPGAESLLALLETGKLRGVSVYSPDIEIAGPSLETALVSAHLAVLGPGLWLIVLSPQPTTALAAQSNAMQNRADSLSAMKAMLAHEIKNPLAAIRGAAQLLGSQEAELSELIVNETQRINHLLDTMELFSSPEDMSLGPVNIHEVLKEVMETTRLSFGNHVRFVEDYDPSLPPVRANPQVLYRICLNLVKNACEACDGVNGRVQLITRFLAAERRRVAGVQVGTELPVILDVVDNGSGIDRDMIDKIFDPFVSAKPAGHGLGLAYVTEAVASLNGLVQVKSAPGRTEFRLRLPRD